MLQVTLTDDDINTLRYVVTTLTHARTFIISRQKMHETGVELYDEDTERLTELVKRIEKLKPDHLTQQIGEQP